MLRYNNGWASPADRIHSAHTFVTTSTLLRAFTKEYLFETNFESHLGQNTYAGLYLVDKVGNILSIHKQYNE